MIKVNLLKNRALNSDVSKVKTGVDTNLADNIGKAGFSTFSLSSPAANSLDKSFKTFECSPVAQFIKLILLVGFIIPLVAYEKKRAASGRELIASKTREMQTYQSLKMEKEQTVTTFSDLAKKYEKTLVKENELLDLKEGRLTGLFGVDELQTLVPRDVWLTSIYFTDRDRLDVAGQTLLDSGLDKLVAALKSSKRLGRISVQQDINVKNPKGRVLNEFRITMYVLNQPLDKQVRGED